MQLKKTVCLYHPDQFITNFCRQRGCLMPLCPSCIRDHSLFHESNQTKPSYFNIYQILSIVQHELYNVIYSLQQNKARNADLNRRINSLDTIIRQKLVASKSMIYALIEQAFTDLEADLRNSLTKLHEQIGLYSLKKCQKYQESLTETLSDLYTINDGLKGQKFLGNMIVFLKDKYQQSTAFNHKLQAYLQANDLYQPKLEISQQAKTAIISNIGRLIRADGKKQLEKKKQKQQQMRSQKSKLTVKQISEKTEKIERSYTPQKSSVYLKPLEPSRANLTNNSLYQNRHSLLPNNAEPSARLRDFKAEFQMLSKKVTQMRKENQLIARQFK